jgi:5-methyltetrahydrofolate--homocysteine methyltransferase
VRPIYEALKERCKREALLVPRVVYGYFPCQSNGNDLIIYQDDERTERMIHVPAPARRKASLPRRLFRRAVFRAHGRCSFSSRHRWPPRKRIRARAFKSDNYADYLYFHGLSVEAAEALAELWHKRIREELGIAGKDAKETTKLFIKAIKARASASAIRRARTSKTKQSFSS